MPIPFQRNQSQVLDRVYNEENNSLSVETVAIPPPVPTAPLGIIDNINLAQYIMAQVGNKVGFVSVDIQEGI